MISNVTYNRFGYVASGLVCDRGLTLGDLIGVFNDFFGRLGNINFLYIPRLSYVEVQGNEACQLCCAYSCTTKE